MSTSDAALLQRFISAWESGDIDAFASLLAEDARFSMPPQPEWFAGRDAVRQFFATIRAADPARRRLLPVAANGGLAVAVYRRATTPDALFEAAAITLLTIRDGQISQMTRFAFPRLFPLFGLPSRLPGGFH